MVNRRWKGNKYTRRDRFVEMLKPFLVNDWHTTRECVDWLFDNSGQKIIPTSRELAPCLARHPKISQSTTVRNRWRWYE